MIQRVLFRPEAESDLASAYRWYEDREEGVGLRLLTAFEEARRRIEERADRLPRLETMPPGREIRRTFLRRFPFMVVFELFPAETAILAVAHSSRRPNYWSQRST